jgi:hypothetical protein
VSTGVCKQILVNLQNTKFHENKFSGSPVVTYGQLDGSAIMLKVTGTFFQLFAANMPRAMDIFL